MFPESAANSPNVFSRPYINAVQHSDTSDLAADHPDSAARRCLLFSRRLGGLDRARHRRHAIFVIAGATDWLDGYLARRWNETSAFGAFLDPVADKLVVATALILLVQFDRVDVIIATIIIGREITISSLREWMAQIGAHRSVAVSMVGKVKTAAQMIAIPLLLYKAPIAGMDTLWIGTQLIYVAAVLTLWSMGYYMRMAWPHLSGHDKK